MTLAALLLHAGLALARPGDAPDPWVAPPSQSSHEGPFGVLFVPRYADAENAAAVRLADLAALEAALPTLDEADRATARERIEQRLDAVVRWRDALIGRVGDPPTAAERAELLGRIDLLSMEETTLRAQLRLLGAPAPAPAAPAAGDRVVFLGDAVIEAEDRVRDAVAFGGDVVVRGVVEHDAVAFGGDVVLLDDGRVLGQTVTFGGVVRRDGVPVASPAGAPVKTPAPPVPPATGAVYAPQPSGWSWWALGWLVPMLGFAGAGVLTVGVAPERVDRVAGMLEHRPAAALVTGTLATVALLLGGLVFVATVVGIPLALLLLAVLATSWLLGTVALCQALGDRLPFAQDRPRWVAFLAGVAVLAVLVAVPILGAVLFLGASVLGLGAAFATRFGRPAA